MHRKIAAYPLVILPQDEAGLQHTVIGIDIREGIVRLPDLAGLQRAIADLANSGIQIHLCQVCRVHLPARIIQIDGQVPVLI